MSWEADCESRLYRFNQPHAVLSSTRHSPNCLICFPHQPRSCCFCIHLAETGELLSGTCWTPALSFFPSTLRLRCVDHGLYNALGLLHSMALNDVVKLVSHKHHTNLILMDPLSCRLRFVFRFPLLLIWNESEDSFLLSYKLDFTYAQGRWLIYSFHKHVWITVKYLSFLLLGEVIKEIPGNWILPRNRNLLMQ